MLEKLVFYTIKAISYIPFWIMYLISDLLAFVATYVFPYRKKVILENLRNSFPEKSEKEIKKIWKSFMRNFTDQMVETIKLFSMTPEELNKRLNYSNLEVVMPYIEKNRSIMFAAGHQGNWEYYINFPHFFKGLQSYNVIYAPINNKYLNDRILENRSRMGCTLIPMKSAMREIARHESEGNFYGFLYDQSPYKTKVRYDLEFLNQQTPVHLGTEVVSKLKNVVVFSVEISKSKRGHYLGELTLLTDNPKETAEFEITHELFRRLEKTIDKYPDMWLWSHKRWKYKRGRDYFL